MSRFWAHKSRGSSYSVGTPMGSVGLDVFGDSGIRRGRCREIDFRIRISRKWWLEFSTPGKDYLTLVAGPKYLKNLDWILDEFDSSFNDLAISSLRYHLHWAVTDNSDNREKYEDLIARLGESAPDPTEEESAAIDTWNPFTEPVCNTDGKVYAHRITDCPPAASAAFESWQAREDGWKRRINQARHDFVDIMPGLWS